MLLYQERKACSVETAISRQARSSTDISPSGKFTLLTLGENEDQLANAYSMNMRLVGMFNHFKRFDLQDVFYIVKTTVDATMLAYNK